MSDFSFLVQNKVHDESQDTGNDIIIYPVREEDIKIAIEKFETNLPVELHQFYQQCGYGFFHRSTGNVNRFMDPFSLTQINLRLDEFEFDPDLEVYDDLYNHEKLLFFEVNEGVYLAMNKIDDGGKNAIYFMDIKVSDALIDFLKAFLENPDLINEL